MPSAPNILPKARRPLGAIVYPDVAMALYVHGLDHKLAGVTSVLCHIGDGSAVCQVGTHGADCGNRNRVGDHISNSQRLVEAPQVAESDCVGSRSEVHKCILDAFR
jgi:hypothetical protein